MSGIMQWSAPQNPLKRSAEDGRRPTASAPTCKRSRTEGLPLSKLKQMLRSGRDIVPEVEMADVKAHEPTREELVEALEDMEKEKNTAIAETNRMANEVAYWVEQERKMRARIEEGEEAEERRNCVLFANGQDERMERMSQEVLELRQEMSCLNGSSHSAEVCRSLEREHKKATEALALKEKERKAMVATIKKRRGETEEARRENAHIVAKEAEMQKVSSFSCEKCIEFGTYWNAMTELHTKLKEELRESFPGAGQD